MRDSFILLGILTPEGRVLEANQAALSALGEEPAAIVGKTYSEIEAVSYSADVLSRAGELLRRAAAGETVRGELRARMRGQRLADLDCMLVPLRDAAGQIIQIAVTAVDVSAQKSAELSLLRVNRELRMLGQCNQALLRADSEEALLVEICRIIVEHGGYTLAWVGIPMHDAHRSVRPVAKAGRESAYLAAARFTWAEDAFGQGPTGRAIRERAVCTVRETDKDPAVAPWREAARRHGFRSSTALPLMSGSGCLGALSIYAERANAFDEAEIALLRELAGDLAFGIAALRAHAARERAQSELKLFRSLLEQSNDLVYIVDVESGRILDANDTTSRRLGYSRAELLRMTVREFSLVAAERPWQEIVARIRSKGILLTEGRHRCKSGEIVPMDLSVQCVEHEKRHYFLTVARDMTERKRHQEQIARLTRILRMQGGINGAVLRIRDEEELLQEACRLGADVGGYDRVVLSLVDATGRAAIPRFSAGRGADFPEPATLPLGDGTGPDGSLSGRALRTGEIVVSNDLTQPEPPVAMRKQLVALGYRSVVAVPLIVEGRRIGALTLASRDPGLVQAEEILLLRDIMATLSFALRSQQQADAAHFLAYFDPLTGLAKRALLCERIDDLLQRRLGPREDLTVIVFDIVGLGHLNDSYGRHFGDLLLGKVAQRLKDRSFGDRRIGYLGNGIFAFVPLTSASEQGGSTALLEGALFGEPFEIEGHTVRLAYRSGVAQSPRDGEDGDTLIQRAEAALKQAKQKGEQYLHYRLEMGEEIIKRLQLEGKLRTAIGARQFDLYYQPQFSLATGQFASVEALLRWNDPDDGVVLPAHFLPVLESSGMLATVGDWAFERVVEDCERWSKLGLRPVRVAVNVSATQLRRAAFAGQMLELQRRLRAAAPGFAFDLEITETALLQDLEETVTKLRELRKANIRVALDDFGTGYSSLGLLSKLPVDLLKIDRSFVNGLPSDPASILLVESIISLAAAFGLMVVAEGVESDAQLQMLRKLRCDLAQGFLHSKPQPRNEIEQLLGRRSG